MQNDSSLEWSTLLPPEKAENKYLLELIRNTEDLSDLTGDDLVDANQRARAAVLEHNEAIQAQSLSAKASKVALQGIATVGGMVAGFAVAKGIELAATAIDNLIHREERLAEAAKEASENIQNSFSSFNSMKQSIGSITQEFAQLSQHVNQATGENIDLPEEEYKRFLELSNQLAETFPNIGYIIDENGNKITGLSGSIDEITQSINDLVQAQQLLTHQEISDNMKDTYKKTKEDVTEYKYEIEYLERQKTISDVQEKAQELLEGEKIKFHMSGPNDYTFLNDMISLFQKEGLKLQFQEGHLSLKQNAKEAELNDTEKNRILSGADQIEAKYADNNNYMDQKIADLQNKIQMSMNSFSPNLQSWITTDQNYAKIVQTYGGDLGIAIQKSIALSDLDSKNWDGMESWITNNILTPLNNADNGEIRQAYIKLFTDTELPLDSAMEYLEQVEEYYHNHDIKIPTVFTEQKEKYSDLQEEFNDRNASFQTGDVNGLNQFFQENSIDEADEYEKWLSVTEGITDATEAMEAWKRATEQETQSPLSFQESWDSLGTTGSDEMKQSSSEAKEQLLELAEAGKLTAEELEKSPAGKTIMEQTKLSAEEAAEAVNKLVDKSSQLSTMKSGIQSISNVLAQKQEYQKNPETQDTGIDSSTLSGFDASIKGLDSWKQFEKTLGNGKSSMEDCQQAANKLATEWVNSNNFLSQLDNTNKEYYISQLKGMGIQNAEAIVTETLANKTRELNAEKQWSKATTTSLANATVGEINNLASLNGWSKQTKNTLYALALQKNLLNGTTLDFSSDISGIIEFVEKLGYSAEAMKTYQTVRAGENGSAGMPSDVSEGYYGKKAQKEINRILKKLKKSSKIKIDPSSDVKEIDENNSDDGNNKTKETKQSFDWLERKVTVLTNKLDLLKAKIENVFSVREKNSIINDEIKKTNALIKTYQKQAKTYKSQANKSAKSQKTATGNDKAKLSGKKGKKLKNQIQTGQIKGSKKQWIDAYGESTANAIEEYQDYWDKYQTAQKNKQDAVKSKRELKIQKRQNWVDYYDSLGSQYDAQIETASTAKTKNKLEKDKLKYVKKSYNQQIKIAKLEQDSVKASTLLAKKWKEIADSRERILQNQLDENAAKRDYNNAAYENADNASKKKIIQSNIATYNNDDQTHAENVKSAQENVANANSNISKTAKAASKRLKKESIDPKIVKEINGYLNSGKKVPDKYMKMAEHTYPELYQKLLAYNNSIDTAGIAKDALAKAQENQQKAAEENETARRDERSKGIQLDIDAATNRRDLLSAQYNNLSSAKEKNDNIDAQLQQQEIIHNKTIEQINNDITDPAERNTALEKEKAEWITTQREQSVLKLQNLADEESAQYTLKQQMEANADTAEKKNEYEAKSLEHLKSQYDYEMQIAKENGDQIEQDRLRLELEQKIEESYQRQIDNIREEYDLIIGMNDARKSTIDAQIAALQANGYGISKELLQQQMTLDEDSYKQSLEEIRRISEKIPSLSGNARKEAEKELEAEKQNAWGYQQNLGELQKAINNIDMAKLERIGTALESYGNNLEFIQDILSHSDFTLSDSEIGGLTTEGLASIAITFAEIANNQEQIDNLYAQIAEKRRQLADTNIEDGDSLTEEIDTLIQKAHDLEKANYDSGESIKTTVIDSLNSLSDALDENISKHKEALQAKKDLFDYNQKIAKQLKSISSLEKQLAALQGSDTEEARARIQKLQIQLEDEQQNLKDMEYDKYIQDQEELLDKVSDDFQGFIASVADMSVSDICAAMSTAVSDNLPAIGTAIEDAFAKSSEIGELATSIDGLSEMIKNLNYSGNNWTDVDANGDIHYGYTDENGNKVDITVNNSDRPGTVTGSTENGKNIPLPEKEVNRTEDRIDDATSALYTKGGSNSTGSRKDIINNRLMSAHYMLKYQLEKLQFHQIKFNAGEESVSHTNIIQELTTDQEKLLHKLRGQLLLKNNFAEFMASLSNISLPTQQSPTTATTIRNVDIHLDGSHVMDADSFIQTLHNPRVLQEISSGISSQLGNVLSNKLGKF